MFNLSLPELSMILLIALVVFGPGKLPEVGKALGKGLNEFRRAMNTDNTAEPINIDARAIEKNHSPVEVKKSDETK